MEKMSPSFSASAAAILYFIIYTMLRYSIQKDFDLQSALMGAVVFWVVIFMIHRYLIRRHGD